MNWEKWTSVISWKLFLLYAENYFWRFLSVTEKYLIIKGSSKKIMTTLMRAVHISNNIFCFYLCLFGFKLNYIYCKLNRLPHSFVIVNNDLKITNFAKEGEQRIDDKSIRAFFFGGGYFFNMPHQKMIEWWWDLVTCHSAWNIVSEHNITKMFRFIYRYSKELSLYWNTQLT